MSSKVSDLSWSKRLDRMLNNPKSKSKRRFDIFISVLVVVSASILFVEGFTHDETYRPPIGLIIVDNFIMLIFLLEYLARVAFAKPVLPEVVEISTISWWRYQIQARIQWMLTPLAIIDLLAILPLFLVDRALSDFKLFRVLRILRLLRLYRIAAFYNPLEKLGRAFRSNSLIYGLAFSLVAVTVAMGGLAFYVVEGESNPSVESPFDAIWWTIVTLTTVGYGDTVPTSDLGKVVAMTLMLAGVTLMAVFAGVMSQTMVGYLLDVREERIRMSATVNHFIICGWNNSGPMVVDELQHLAPEEEIIVFADRAEPPDLPSGATFLQGNPTKEAEWDKVRLSMATNILLLAPPTLESSQSVTSDGYTALVVYPIRSYERKLVNKGVKRSVPLHISAELLDPENFEHLTTAGADEVIHTAQVGSNLIAHSTVKPGMGIVVTELLSWWGQGLDLEPVPSDLSEEETFESLSAQMRKSRGYLLVGLIDGDGKITLNPPFSCKITANHTLVVIRKHQDSDE